MTVPGRSSTTPLADPRIETLVAWAQASEEPFDGRADAAVAALGDSPPAGDAASALALVAAAAYARVPRRGPRDLQGGHAIVALLEGLGEPGARELVRLAERVRYRYAQEAIRRTLARLARHLGTPLGELEDSFDGPRVSDDLSTTLGVGPFAATIQVADDLRRVRTSWTGRSGRPVRSRPRNALEHPDALELLKAERRRLQAHLSNLRSRLEQAMLSERSWSVEQWATRMFADPLRGALARRLIWGIDGPAGTRLAIAEEGGLRGLAGEPVGTPIAANITLWHPADDPTAQEPWQRRLAELQIVQPIDQAAREVTVADPVAPSLDLGHGRRVDQTPFRGFLMTRGWQVPFLGPWFTVPEGTRELLPGGPTAVLHLEYDETDDERTARVNELAFRTVDSRPLDARRLPPRLVSEAARDILGALKAAGGGTRPA